jgi:hypothetical protein
MDLLEQAFRELYPEKNGYSFRLDYGNLHGYNGKIRMQWKNITCELSLKWKPISDDIQIGMMQCLLVRLFRDKKNTINMDLYNGFVRNLHLAIPKTKIDPLLKEAFDRVNENYFDNSIEIANLVFSGESARLLGSYNYKTDTIKISNIFRELEQKYLDYVMYHEMLHKKHKFKDKNGRSFHHTSVFRKDEKKFENSEIVEKELQGLVSRKRAKRFFDWF